MANMCDVSITITANTAKHKIKILMTGETRPDEAIVYADKEGNNFLHIVLQGVKRDKKK